MSTAHDRIRAAAPTSDRSLAFLIADVMRLMRRDFRARSHGLGLTPALTRLLFYVDRQPGCRQTELAGFLDVTPVTLGRMIDRLERQSLVRRVADPADRRVFRIHIASAARPLVARMNALVAKTSEHALADLPRAEREALLGALERVRSRLMPGGE